MKRARLLSAILLAGCASPRTSELRNDIGLLHGDEPNARAVAFRTLVRAPSGILPFLRRDLREGYAQGFPLAAVLVARGEADEVPLEIKILHLARFEWPAATETAILEPVVRHALEREVLRAGRPGLRLLARALERDAVTEARGLDLLRLMIDLAAPAGTAGLEEFARLLESARELGGENDPARVCDLAGAALLHLGMQEARLAEATGAGGIAGEARAWWNASGDLGPDHWLREGAARAVELMSRVSDPAPWIDYLNLILGRPLASEREARDAWNVWRDRPSPEAGFQAPGRDRAPHLARILRDADRGRAWQANRLLELECGVRLQPTPKLVRASDLAWVRAGWRPAPLLAQRWERWLESASLRLTVWRVGRGSVLWMNERFFHATEDVMTGGVWKTAAGDEEILHLQTRRLGTSLLGSAYVGFRGFTEEVPVDPGTPHILFAPDAGTCTVVRIDEPPRRAPPALERTAAEAAEALRRGFVRMPPERCGRIARALGYLQDASAVPLIEARVRDLQGSPDPDRAALRALAEALLLLDAASGLDLAESTGITPNLTRAEAETLGLSARDPRVRAWLAGRR
jgi:hypothetical protein